MDDAQKFQILKAAAQLTFRDYGVWLFDTWASHNQTYFDNQLKVIPLTFGLLPHGALLGQFHQYEEDGYSLITLHKSLLDPKGDAWQVLPLLGSRFAGDVLLHEMMHQSVFQQNEHNGTEDFFGSSSHNNQIWCDEINRIAPMLGLSTRAATVKRQRTVDPLTGKKTKLQWFVPDGFLSRSDLGKFPHCVTADDYYEGQSESRRGKRSTLPLWTN